MSDPIVDRNLRNVEVACQVDEGLKKLREYLISLAKGEMNDNIALFADGAFERALQIAESEQKIEDQELIEETRSEQPINGQEGFEPGD